MESTKKVMEDLKAIVQEEPKTISTIEINLKERKELLLEAYSQCDLCGSELEFSQVTNFILQEVNEESFCPSCNIHSAQSNHPLN